jgi:hypothetical protein
MSARIFPREFSSQFLAQSVCAHWRRTVKDHTLVFGDDEGFRQRPALTDHQHSNQLAANSNRGETELVTLPRAARNPV